MPADYPTTGGRRRRYRTPAQYDGYYIGPRGGRMDRVPSPRVDSWGEAPGKYGRQPLGPEPRSGRGLFQRAIFEYLKPTDAERIRRALRRKV